MYNALGLVSSSSYVWDRSDRTNDRSGLGQQSAGIRQSGFVRDSGLVLLLRRKAADEQEVQSDILEWRRRKDGRIVNRDF